MKKFILMTFFFSLQSFSAIKPLVLENTVQINGKKYKKIENLPKLVKGSRIETGTRSFFIFQVKNEFGTSKFRMGPKSSLTIEEQTLKAGVFLKKGSIFSKYSRKKASGKDALYIKTRTAAFGVRGTFFFTSYGKGEDLWMCVKEGKVKVDQKGEVKEVKAGEGIFIKKNELTEPKFYEWTKKINWNDDPNKGSLETGIDAKSMYIDLIDVDYD